MRRLLHIFIWLGMALPFLSARAGESLTVLTWNTGRMGQYAKPEKNEVLQYLLSQNADIICLQEVDVYKDARFLTLPELKAALSRKYPYSYIDFAVYNSRHQFGTMVWSRYPLVNKQSIHYETRANLSNRCDVVIGADTVRLFNNHLESYSFTPADLADVDSLHNYKGLVSTLRHLKTKWQRAVPLRNKQAQIVRTEIDASPHPVIVVGDFNSVEWSMAYWTLSSGLYDAWRETHHFWEWGATCEHRGIGLRIDYILSSNTLVPVACSVPETTGSDHRPVVAVLRIKKD
ncbi:MAG: endonuclease/exonuclease/phosphatase family protein [Paludibacteraceae bacterium]|jgi:endonuclease/exonuclease/phosphatase family metal-dependent hydrolase|nr:endonuclease/exonuclease/phosphatase family protein [Paludibacteraceae bacterium]MBR0065205.1 endonuclease/exonuclease/phosphatase family protein [Paludibacteraceae bacterium]